MSDSYRNVVVGIDQSYKRTGISVSADGKLLRVHSIDLSKFKSKSEKREHLRKKVDLCLQSVSKRAETTTIIIERIRTFSNGFLSTPYIKSIGALNAVVVDTAFKYGIEVYNVDTRAWKSAVVGTSKPMENSFGVPDKKWPTVMWCCDQGFEKQLLHEVSKRRKSGTFEYEGKRFEYDNDAADSAAISMFFFVGDRTKLKQEQ